MKYFKLNITPEQALSRFQKLAGTFHPDKPENSTDGTEFIELKQEYDDFKIILKHLAWIRRELNQIPIVKEKIVYVPQKPQYNPIELVDKGKDIANILLKIAAETNKSIVNASKLYRQTKKK